MNPISPCTTRRRTLLALALGLGLGAGAASAAPRPTVDVWKDPSCGCCKDWVATLERAGFGVRLFETGNAAVRTRLGMPQALGSCHTARVAGYVLEGHVPVADIERLLRDKPRALGLAVPGMPIGSPGMDGPAYQGRRDAYAVLLVGLDGSTTVYQSYPAAKGTS
ncbi:MAG: DUF411 domain-containing protein [Rhodoferax sp.]